MRSCTPTGWTTGCRVWHHCAAHSILLAALHGIALTTRHFCCAAGQAAVGEGGEAGQDPQGREGRGGHAPLRRPQGRLQGLLQPGMQSPLRIHGNLTSCCGPSRRPRPHAESATAASGCIRICRCIPTQPAASASNSSAYRQLMPSLFWRADDHGLSLRGRGLRRVRCVAGRRRRRRGRGGRVKRVRSPLLAAVLTCTIAAGRTAVRSVCWGRCNEGGHHPL